MERFFGRLQTIIARPERIAPPAPARLACLSRLASRLRRRMAVPLGPTTSPRRAQATRSTESPEAAAEFRRGSRTMSRQASGRQSGRRRQSSDSEAHALARTEAIAASRTCRRLGVKLSFSAESAALAGPVAGDAGLRGQFLVCAPVIVASSIRATCRRKLNR